MASSAATRDARSAALQLTAMADSALRRFCVLFLFYFIVLLDNFKNERERQKEKGRESL
jgi:hypothetical protein